MVIRTVSESATAQPFICSVLVQWSRFITHEKGGGIWVVVVAGVPFNSNSNGSVVQRLQHETWHSILVHSHALYMTMYGLGNLASPTLVD